MPLSSGLPGSWTSPPSEVKAHPAAAGESLVRAAAARGARSERARRRAATPHLPAAGLLHHASGPPLRSSEIARHFGSQIWSKKREGRGWESHVGGAHRVAGQP